MDGAVSMPSIAILGIELKFQNFLSCLKDFDMERLTICFIFLAVASVAKCSPQDEQGQGAPRRPFDCPEENGLFADSEQCDLYYICEKGVAEEVLCDDGLLFDDSIRNREKCVLPHNVDCRNRVFVQEPTLGIDEKCPRANGIFDHPDEAVCDKFITCDKGVSYEQPCSPTLFFDNTVGTCVRKEQLSPDAKNCDGQEGELVSIDGFTCPGKERIGPQGLLQQHPIFPHPSDCQFFFTCYFGKEPNKFGCSKGSVFDEATQVCKDPSEVPECGCWYECPEDSKCPDSCNADCSCPVDDSY